MSIRFEKEEDVIEALRRSKGQVGYIEPVIVDKKTKEVVIGYHRKRADPNWIEREMEFQNEKQKLLFKIHSDTVRRTVTAKERQSQLIRLASILESEGIPREQICTEIVKLAPFDETYVRKLLPAKYKQPVKRKAAKLAVKPVYEEKKEVEAKPAEKKPPPKLMCPICGSPLALVGDLLVPYHEALKR